VSTAMVLGGEVSFFGFLDSLFDFC
jgi:hypothetical protein